MVRRVDKIIQLSDSWKTVGNVFSLVEANFSLGSI